MARNIDKETTVTFTCDICGKADVGVYMGDAVSGHAPEGWEWLLTFRHDQEPRLSANYNSYSGSKDGDVIKIPGDVKAINPNVICLTCAKGLKQLVKWGASKVQAPEVAPVPMGDASAKQPEPKPPRVHLLAWVAFTMFWMAAASIGTFAWMLLTKK